jgi:hypothetical protein
MNKKADSNDWIILLILLIVAVGGLVYFAFFAPGV